jgi:hypothetical protein
MIELFDAGMALARFNLAHGNLKVSVKNYFTDMIV